VALAGSTDAVSCTWLLKPIVTTSGVIVIDVTGIGVLPAVLPALVTSPYVSKLNSSISCVVFANLTGFAFAGFGISAAKGFTTRNKIVCVPSGTVVLEIKDL